MLKKPFESRNIRPRFHQLQATSFHHQKVREKKTTPMLAANRFSPIFDASSSSNKIIQMFAFRNAGNDLGTSDSCRFTWFFFDNPNLKATFFGQNPVLGNPWKTRCLMEIHLMANKESPKKTRCNIFPPKKTKHPGFLGEGFCHPPFFP